MPREYSVTFEKVAVSAVQDIIQVTGATGKMLKVTRFYAECADAAPTSQNLVIRARYLPATVTNGSGGGGSVTPRARDPGDPAASFTALRNNTVQATSSNTATIQEEGAWNVLAGYDNTLENPIWVGPTAACTFELITAPNTTVTLSGGVEVTEIG